MQKKVYQFIESCLDGHLSKMQTMGGTYHAVRIDSGYIFGVVELEPEQKKIIDADDDITLFTDTRVIAAGKNSNQLKKQLQMSALKKCGINPDVETGQDALDKMFDLFGHPAFL